MSNKLTRRQVLQALAILPAVALLPELPIVESPVEVEPVQVTNVSVSATVPDPATIKDPVTLAEYMGRMEAYLTQTAKAWEDDGDPDIYEMLRVNIEAYISGFSAFLAVIENTGYGNLIQEIVTPVDGPFENAVMINTDGYYKQFIRRQDILDNFLWGQEPPQPSENLCNFNTWRSLLLDCLSGRQFLVKTWGNSKRGWQEEVQEPQEETVLSEPEPIQESPKRDWTREQAEKAIAGVEEILAEMRVKYLG